MLVESTYHRFHKYAKQELIHFKVDIKLGQDTMVKRDS